jgi:hypothetical protein
LDALLLRITRYALRPAVYRTTNESMFPPLDPTEVRRILFTPACSVTVTLTVRHVAHPPVLANDSRLFTTAPFNFSSSGRSDVLPLA